MTPTRTLTGYMEVITQFIHDFQLPDPRLLNIYTNENIVSMQFDGDGATANLVSESLYWETSEIGITQASVKFDGVDITVHVFNGAES